MKHKLLVALTLAAFASGLFSIAHAGDIKPGQIHSYPYSENPEYRPHQLSFEPPDDGLARAEFLSEEFYAVILKSAKRCTIGENERAAVQKLFSKNKVFMDRFNCDDDVEEVITYTNVNHDYAFIAVHAGKTLEDAKALIENYNLSSKFPGANIRQMQAVIAYP